MKTKHMLGALMALLIAPFAACARLLAPRGLDANNIAGDRDESISRIAEVAIATPHLLLAAGTNKSTQVIINVANTRPIGVSYDRYVLGERATVRRLNDGKTKLVIASKAIAADVDIYTAAAGKVTDVASANCYRIGRSLAAAAADGDELEIDPCFPVLTP